MARRTRAELQALRQALIPDNPLHAITPANVRAYEQELADSALILADDGLPATPGAATYATIAGSPFESAPLAAALNRTPNRRPGGPFEAVYATDADAAAYNDASAITLEYLVRTRSTLCHLGMRLTAELALNGAAHEYTLVYDGATRTGNNAPGLRVFKTGEMVPGDLVPAKMVPADSAEVTAADYASFPAGFLFTADQLVRAYVPGTTAQQFASARFPGAHSAPTAALLDFTSSPNGADVNWKFVGRDAVPTTGNGIPLTGTTPAAPVSGMVEFQEDAGVQFSGSGGDPSYKLYNSAGQLRLYDPSTGQIVAVFDSVGRTSLYTGTNAAVLTVGANDELLVNGQPIPPPPPTSGGPYSLKATTGIMSWVLDSGGTPAPAPVLSNATFSAA
jgi:hypothetical protein